MRRNFTVGPERPRDGYDVAYVAVLAVGMFLFGVILALGIDIAINGQTAISDNGQLVIVAGLGTIGSVASGALGYWAGSSRPQPEEEPEPVIDVDPDEGA